MTSVPKMLETIADTLFPARVAKKRLDTERDRTHEGQSVLTQAMAAVDKVHELARSVEEQIAPTTEGSISSDSVLERADYMLQRQLASLHRTLAETNAELARLTELKRQTDLTIDALSVAWDAIRTDPVLTKPGAFDASSERSNT